MIEQKKEANFNIRGLQGLQFHVLNNQYRIGQLISYGGYGCVFYAEDKNGQSRAIKAVDMNLTNPSIRSCLQKQDKAMKMIQAENVIQYYDSQVDTIRNIKYIVMDLCNSYSLWHLIVYKGHLLEIQAKIYLKNILAGLISMFRYGYSHRDIKSSNICLKNGSCVIIDLGCTKQFSSQIGQGSIKSKTMLSRVGTVMNKSPEMLRKQKYTYRTDLWAVGILYYEMLCGVTPFHLTGNQQDDQAFAHIQNNIGHIYEESYIQARIKQQYRQQSSTFQFRANKKLSPGAIEFLSNLIVIQPEKRSSEEAIKKSPYLRQKIQISEKNIWEVAQCVLPVKNIDWEQFVAKLDKKQFLQVAQSELKVNVEQNVTEQKQSILNSNNIVKQMLFGQKREINEKYQRKIQDDKAQLNRARYLDFQIKRIILLMKLRKYLKKIQSANPKLMCFPAVLKISEYCNFKFSQIVGAARQHNIGLYTQNKNSKINNSFLLEYLSEVYVEDLEWQKSNGWKKIKADEANESQIYNELFMRIKSEGLKISKDYVCFFQNYKIILDFKYSPNIECPEWISWSSFRFIFELASNS